MNQFNEIEQFTTNVIGKVDEIIWALNPEQDSLRDMINYIIDYCQRFITHKYIKGSIKKPDKISDKSISSVFRRNVFLVVKEGMNNIIKHSEATEFTIELEESGEKLYVLLKDNGNGFRDDDKLERGNGLLNIKKGLKNYMVFVLFNQFLESEPHLKLLFQFNKKNRHRSFKKSIQ